MAEARLLAEATLLLANTTLLLPDTTLHSTVTWLTPTQLSLTISSWLTISPLLTNPALICSLWSLLLLNILSKLTSSYILSTTGLTILLRTYALLAILLPVYALLAVLLWVVALLAVLLWVVALLTVLWPVYALLTILLPIYALLAVLLWIYALLAVLLINGLLVSLSSQIFHLLWAHRKIISLSIDIIIHIFLCPFPLI